jgi:hypothetical protein
MLLAVLSTLMRHSGRSLAMPWNKGLSTAYMSSLDLPPLSYSTTQVKPIHSVSCERAKLSGKLAVQCKQLLWHMPMLVHFRTSVKCAIVPV